MAKKEFFLIVDTETTQDGLVADFGAVVVDRKGKIHAQCAVMIHGIFTDMQNHPLFFTSDDNAIWGKNTVEEPGDVVELDGTVVGQHEGIEYFTIGQRRGLGVSGGEPRFVIRLEPESSRVVIGPEEALLRDEMRVSGVNYPLGNPPPGPVDVNVKIRYKSNEAAAVLNPCGDGAVLRFVRPQRSVTPGQAAVFYQGDVLLGGGTIEPGMGPDMGPVLDPGVSEELPAATP